MDLSPVLRNVCCPCLLSTLTSHSETLDQITFPNQPFTIMKFQILILSAFLIKNSNTELRGPDSSNSLSSSPYPDCSSSEGGREGRVCNTVTECEDTCDKNDCQTKYEYKCTDYKRQECRNKWQYFCRTSSPPVNNRVKRTARIGRLFWEKISKLFAPVSHRRSDRHEDQISATHDDDADDDEEEEGQSDAGQCWRLVRQCQWVKYKTVCQNKPVTSCKVR